eukprot:scaffold216623_cov21-Tisochrysis_lutea.AAC.1
MVAGLRHQKTGMQDTNNTYLTARFLSCERAPYLQRLCLRYILSTCTVIQLLPTQGKQHSSVSGSLRQNVA